MGGKWLWQSDTGWIEYDINMCRLLEEAYKKKEKQFKVDEQRFIDLENMLQRRYDDVSKRRLIKREEVPDLIFDKDIIFILAKTVKKSELLNEQIIKAGGLIAHLPAGKCTLVICSNSEAKDFIPEIKEARKLKIPIVTPDFIVDSVTEDKKQDPEDYLTRLPKELTNATDSPAVITPAVIIPAVITSPVATTTVIDKLQINSKWTGASTQDGVSHYAFELTIISRTENNFEGYMIWTSLNNCKTKVTGSISGRTANLAEIEVLSGDDVEVPNKYIGEISDDGGSIKGNYADYEGAPGTFHLTFQSVSDAAVPTPMDITGSNTPAMTATVAIDPIIIAFSKLQPGTSWNVQLQRPINMELDIDTTADNAFTAKVNKEDIKTDIKGSWTSTDFKMEDDQFTYDGKFDGTKKNNSNSCY